MVNAACMVTMWAPPATTLTPCLIAPPTTLEAAQHTATITALWTELAPVTDTEIVGLIGSAMNRAWLAVRGLRYAASPPALTLAVITPSESPDGTANATTAACDSPGARLGIIAPPCSGARPLVLVAMAVTATPDTARGESFLTTTNTKVPVGLAAAPVAVTATPPAVTLVVGVGTLVAVADGAW